jgi:hypothetical protein
MENCESGEDGNRASAQFQVLFHELVWLTKFLIQPPEIDSGGWLNHGGCAGVCPSCATTEVTVQCEA